MMHCLRRFLLSLIVASAFLSLGDCFTAPSYGPQKTVHEKQQYSPSALSMGIMEDLGGFMKRFTQKATASHILIKGGAEAENKLEDMKAEIGSSPVKFAQFAEQYSACPSGRSGGTLGEFGPGAMVKEFDQVVFNEEVGVVHGPIKTQVCTFKSER
jgi:peptidyl-prolyl cis-trans isomerase C